MNNISIDFKFKGIHFIQIQYAWNGPTHEMFDAQPTDMIQTSPNTSFTSAFTVPLYSYMVEIFLYSAHGYLFSNALSKPDHHHHHRRMRACRNGGGVYKLMLVFFLQRHIVCAVMLLRRVCPIKFARSIFVCNCPYVRTAQRRTNCGYYYWNVIHTVGSVFSIGVLLCAYFINTSTASSTYIHLYALGHFWDNRTA